MLGSLFLMYGVYTKLMLVRFRKTALEVSGVVLKVFPHSRSTSYFLAYDYEGTRRIAEYSGPPLLRQYEPGASIRVLIDPSAPPDVPLPGDTHVLWFGSVGGNCILADQPLLTFADALIVGAFVYLLGAGWLFSR